METTHMWVWIYGNNTNVGVDIDTTQMEEWIPGMGIVHENENFCSSEADSAEREKLVCREKRSGGTIKKKRKRKHLLVPH